MIWEQLATIAIAAFLLWNLFRGRTYSWCQPDHPDRCKFPPNARPVDRTEEPARFWLFTAWGFAMLALMTYGTFIK